MFRKGFTCTLHRTSELLSSDWFKLNLDDFIWETKQVHAGFVVRNNTSVLVGADSIPVANVLVLEVEIRSLWETLIWI